MQRKKKSGLRRQVILLFAACVLLTGILTFFSQGLQSEANVKQQIETNARQIAEEVSAAVTQYPACDWLLEYWFTHAEELDIEYDAGFEEGTKTEEKSRIWNERHPEILLDYITTEEIAAMPDEDQKLYAEIIYSRLIYRLDQIKKACKVDYLFGVITAEPYDTQFFLFSAADEGAVRGTDYEEVYTLGVTVEVGESQSDAMRHAEKDSGHLASAGDYMDYYAPLEKIGDHIILTGLTYNLTGMRSIILVQTIRTAALAILYQILLAALCMILLYFVVLKPLRSVQKSIRTYEQDKDSQAVKESLASVHPNNEIGQLSEDVISLTGEIDDYLKRISLITAEKERISTEMALATRIQSNMLPSTFPAFPERPEFDIYASMDPAKEVGGDFYDFFMLDDDRLCIVIADVSGKGVPAALMMMASKIILEQIAQSEKSPAKILSDTNETICQNNKEDMFITVWLGILEISTGTLTAANAGHEYPILKSPGGSFNLIKDKHGFILGSIPGIEYKEYEFQLNPGTKLFLYTDGLSEAMNREKKLFGTSRVVEALNLVKDEPAKKILEHMHETVDAFVDGAEQFDDLTMLCFEYKGL